MGIVRLFAKSEFRNNWWWILKQMLFYVPVVSIILMFATTQNIKYQNQYEFLKNVEYNKIIKSDNTIESINGKNSFQVFKGKLVTIEKYRGADVYKTNVRCEIFNTNNKKYDFEKTYFTEKNMWGNSIDNLGQGEILLSYNAAERLEVGVGDTITLASDNDGDDVDLIVAGIIKTKYAYGKIGSQGTAIVNSNELSKWSCDNAMENYTLTFCGDDENYDGEVITLDEEIAETNYFKLPMESVIAVNVLFPVFGFLLIFILMHRENKNVMLRKGKNLAILNSLGMSLEKITIALNTIYFVIYALSVAIALIIYKYGLIEGYVGEYVPFSSMMYSVIGCMLAGIMAFAIECRITILRMKSMDVIDLISQQEE